MIDFRLYHFISVIPFSNMMGFYNCSEKIYGTCIASAETKHFSIGEYQQNLCDPSNNTCVPCKNRLPSCVSLPDGRNAIQWLLWKQDYAICYKNRTMAMDKCKTRFFHPTQRKCVDKVTPCK